MTHFRTISLLFLLSLTIHAQPAQAHPWGGLVIDSVGRIFFSFVCPIVGDSHVACIWQLDPGETSPKTTLSAQSSPSDLILARSYQRHLYSAEREMYRNEVQAKLWRLMDTGAHQTVIKRTRNPFHFSPEAFTVDHNGTLFFAHEAKIYQHTSSGEISIIAGNVQGYKDGIGVNAQFDRITSMAWGPDSTLYIVDRDRLRRMRPSGEIDTIAAKVKETSPPNLPFSGANIIFDMAIDSLGNAYLAYYGNRRVLKVSASGEVTTLLEAEEDWSPHGVDCFAGDVYVLESTVGVPAWWQFWKSTEIRPRIRKINQAGEVETIYEHPSAE